jgi:FtsZ-interacting cell division protein ZipA
MGDTDAQFISSVLRIVGALLLVVLVLETWLNRRQR